MSKQASRSQIFATVFCLALASGSTLSSSAALAEDEAATTASEVGIAGGSALASLLYTPAKLVYAGTGGLVGGLAWAFSGGDEAVAGPIVDRAWGGDYYVTPDHLRERSIAFVGEVDAEMDAAPGDWAIDSLPDVSAAPPPEERGDCDVAEPPAVFFATGSARLGLQSRATLDAVRATMRACPDLRFEIAASTDATGSAATNRKLAEERADAVRTYLVDRGIGAARFSQREPREAEAGARPEDRRVDLVALSGS